MRESWTQRGQWWGGGLAAGALSALLVLASPASAPVWLPTLAAIMFLQRARAAGLLAVLVGSSLTRALALDAEAGLFGLGMLLLQAAIEAALAWQLVRGLETRFPRALLRADELLPLAARRLLPPALLGGAALAALQPPHGGLGWLIEVPQFAAAQLLALFVGYLLLLDPPHWHESAPARRWTVGLIAALALALAASLLWPPSWLLVPVLLGWIALRAELRVLAGGGVLVSAAVGAAALLGAQGWLLAEGFGLALSAALLLLHLLAIECVHREASRSQMDTLIYARTEALQAELARRRALEQRLQEAAQYDLLTGVPNRALLLDRLGQAIADARRQRTGLAVACLDLDGLQVINDVCGRAAGDRALAELAGRLQRSLRESDTVARVGGGRFVLLALRAPTPEAAAEVAMRVLATLEPPLLEDAPGLALAGSLGIALFPRHGDSPERLLQLADAATEDVKRCGSSGWMLHAGAAIGADHDDTAHLADPDSDQSSSSE